MRVCGSSAVALVFTLVVSLWSVGHAQLQASAPWPIIGGNARHTGLSSYLGPQSATLTWTYTTGNYVSTCATSSADGTVYFGSNDYHLYALNGFTGLLKWSYSTGAYIGSSPAISADGTIYVGSDDFNVYALNGSTGALRWSFAAANVVDSSPVIGADGTVYVGSDDYNVYALNGVTGVLKWSYTTGAAVFSSPAIGTGGTVFVGSLDNTLYALNGSTGALNWSFTTAGSIWSSPAIGNDGTVYVGSWDYRVYALNGTTGTLRWSYTTGNYVTSMPAIGADGTVYVGSWDYNVYALNGTSGALKWSYATGSTVGASAVIGSDGTVYIGSSDKNLRALNGTTGSLLWNYVAGGAVHNLAFGAAGMVLASSDDFKVYAFAGPSSSPTSSTSPTSTATSSPTPTASPTALSTGTATTTSTTTPSATATPSTSFTTTAASSATASSHPSATLTPSATPSSSPTPSSTPDMLLQLEPLIVLPASGDIVASFATPYDGPLIACEAWPPSRFLARVRFPSVATPPSLACTAGSYARGPSTQLLVHPLEPIDWSAAAMPSHLNFTYDMALTAVFNNALPTPATAIEDGYVTCTLSTPAMSSTVTLPVLIMRPRWPLVQDLVLQLPGGTIRSVWHPTAVNVTDLALGSCSNAATRALPVDAALRNPIMLACIIGALALEDGISPMASAAALGQDATSPISFGSTLDGALYLTLVADAFVWYQPSANASGPVLPAFDLSTAVFIDNISCPVQWVSLDGSMLQILTPNVSAICPDGVATCGYHTLQIARPLSSYLGTAAQQELLAAQPLVSASLPPSLTVACPPLCPGLFTATVPAVVPAALLLPDASTTSALPAYLVGGGSAATLSFVPPPSLNGALLSTGIYYIGHCIGFADPLFGSCINASDPRSFDCAYGSGEGCQPCPTGGLCPGGDRVWSRPGYFVTLVDAPSSVVPCSPPALQRCIGWDAATGQTQCGVGYRQGSIGCQSCGGGYFAALDGTCEACPPPNDVLSLFRTLILFVIAAAAFAALNYGLIVVAAKCRGGTVSGGARRSFSFLVWLFTVLQLVAQVGKSASPGLPPFLRTFYAALDVFQLGGLAPPATCVNAYPFLSEAGELGLVLALVVLLLVLGWVDKLTACLRRCSRACAGRRVLASPLPSAPDNALASGVMHKVNPMCTAPTAAMAATAPPKRTSFAALVDAIWSHYDRIPAALAFVTVTLLTLLYPLAVRAAMAMVYCVSVTVSVLQYDALDQDGASLARAGLHPSDYSSPLTIRVLAVDQYYVCYEARHAPVGILAWFALILYGVGYPLATALWVWQRVEAEAARLANPEARRRWWCARMHVLALSAPQAAPEFNDEELLKLAPALTSHPVLAHFAATDYAPRFFFFHHADLLALFVLSLLLVFWPNPPSTASAVGKLVVTLTVLLSLFTVFAVVRPFQAELWWQWCVKLGSLIVASVAAILSCMVSVQAQASSLNTGAPSSSVQDMSLLVFVLCILLAAGLVIVFWWALLRGAQWEHEELVGRRGDKGGVPRDDGDPGVSGSRRRTALFPLAESLRGEAITLSPERRTGSQEARELVPSVLAHPLQVQLGNDDEAALIINVANPVSARGGESSRARAHLARSSSTRGRPLQGSAAVSAVHTGLLPMGVRVSSLRPAPAAEGADELH